MDEFINTAYDKMKELHDSLTELLALYQDKDVLLTVRTDTIAKAAEALASQLAAADSAVAALASEQAALASETATNAAATSASASVTAATAAQTAAEAARDAAVVAHTAAETAEVNAEAAAADAATSLASIQAVILTGTGSPETVVAADPGTLYLDLAGGAGVTLYVKESGVATNTGWVAK